MISRRNRFRLERNRLGCRTIASETLALQSISARKQIEFTSRNLTQRNIKNDVRT
jgi:hypothetical protein